MVKIYRAGKLYATLSTYEDAALVLLAHPGLIAKINGRIVWAAKDSANGFSDSYVVARVLYERYAAHSLRDREAMFAARAQVAQ